MVLARKLDLKERESELIISFGNILQFTLYFICFIFLINSLYFYIFIIITFITKSNLVFIYHWFYMSFSYLKQYQDNSLVNALN